MRRLNALISLEIYALVLTAVQLIGGVRTDEAKYLLNIPYPHPPLVRTLLSWTEFLPFQECLWRFLFASLLAQAVWLVWDLGRGLGRRERMFLSACWLLASGVLLQAGGIYLVCFTALQALCFLWLVARMPSTGKYAGWVALLWLASLFTAYQAALFLPLVCAYFLRAKISWEERIAYVCLPPLLLILYSLSNPLSIASMFIHGGRDLNSSIPMRALGTLRVWMLGGSLLLSIAGTIGIFWSKRWELILSFLLVSAYVALSRYDYYMVLFTPFFIVGLAVLLKNRALPKVIINAGIPLLVIATIITVFFFPPILKRDPSRAVMRSIASERRGDEVLIAGSFGHQWQYESTLPVRSYSPNWLPHARAVICLQPCGDMAMHEGWVRKEESGVEVWGRE
ncbi:MAG: hypothetical protein Q7R81_01670 [Candidatus Peregrinibacteria bacterium]|nr:hypothetical protein [Candidatus Peregrinibacteria bacterium]